MTPESVTFLVGTGRSGSSLLARLISRHPKLGFLTRLSARYPARPELTRWSLKLLAWPGGRRLLRSWSEISEAYPFWEHRARGFAAPLRDLTESDLTPHARRQLRAGLAAFLTGSRPHLFAKITGWSRIRYLRALYPDARFIHLVRDGRDVANSFLRVSFWRGWQGPQNWRFGPLADRHRRTWERHDRSFVALAALNWKILVDSVERSRASVPADRFHQVRYEDLLDEPEIVLRDLLDFAGLEWTEEVERAVRRADFHDPRGRYRDDLSPEQQQILESVLHDDLERLGYPVREYR